MDTSTIKQKTTDTRSRRMYLNIILSFLVKGWSGVVQLLLVPLTLCCLNNYEYGIWLIISSILVWIDSFDIGLGNGLRNRLATYVAHDDWQSAGQAVSTTFFTLLGVMAPLTLIICSLIPVLDLYTLLNVDPVRVPHLTGILQVSAAFVCATFVFKMVGNVFLGLQLPAVNNALVVLGQTLSLGGIFALSYTPAAHDFTAVAIVYTAAPFLVYAAAFPVTFGRLYPRLRPRLRDFRRKMLREIFALGISFFGLQIFGIILFTTSNIIISRYAGPAEVPPYQIAYRYFSLVLMLFTIIITPLWSATTDAHAKGDTAWIRKSCRHALLMLGVMLLLLVVMVAASGFVYPFWTLGKVEVPLEMTILMALYVLELMFSLLYAQFIYGFGTIRLQMLATGLEAAAFIPLAIVGIRHYGVCGLLVALIAVNALCAVTNFVQFHKIIGGRATGIWKR